MTSPTPPEAYGAALAGLPRMGPARLTALLQRWPPPVAWARAREGRVLADAAVAAACRPDPPAVAAGWRDAAVRVDVEGAWQAYEEAGVRAHLLGTAGYPDVLAGDPEPPAVLFTRGSLGALDGPRVAVVGTRGCTSGGRRLAHGLGHDLATAGVAVVSGLALGIDGAAHEGALAAAVAPPVGVVGSGLDVVYPRRHRRLWDAVAEAGVLLSEAPLGGAPEPWRFPARNRIIAALAQVVVVVESHARGGSRHTVDAALDRGRTVMAVPGSVHSPASEGTNDLLAQGLPPARDATDVLVALGLSTTAAAPPPPDPRPPPSVEEVRVLDLLGWEAVTLDQVLLRTGLTPAAAAVALAHLERDGWIVRRDGWWERVPPPAGRASVR